MAWTVVYLNSTKRQLRKMDPQVRDRILRFMGDRVAGLAHPHAIGRALTGVWQGYWRYRVGDYRVICKIRSEELLVMVAKAGHRSDVYDGGPEDWTEGRSSRDV